MDLKIIEKAKELKNEMSLEESSQVLSNSFNDITNLLKAIASPKRLMVLNYLLQQPRNFSFLLNKLRIKRTTLVHHLDFLIETNLIDREDWGRYCITDIGLKFIKAITSTYQNIIFEQQEEHQQIINQYNQWPQFYRASGVIKENLVSNEAKYQSGWNSYISATSGVLISLGVPHDYIYIGGRTGYCFIVNATHLISASILSKNAWQEIYKGTESFGWKMNLWKKKRKYSCAWQLENEDYDLGLDVFNQVAKIIDDYNTPVVLLGVHGSGFAIINGYQNDSYLVSTYYHIEGREEIPIRFDQLRLINKFTYFYFTKNQEKENPEFEDKKSIKRAIEFAKGIHFSQSDFTSGPQAYDTWIDVLSSGKKDHIEKIGNNILGQFDYDSKSIATEYLERLYYKYKENQQAQFLKDASQCYKKAMMELEPFTQMFPHPKQRNNNLTLESRNNGVKILKKVKNYQIDAIENLEKAYEKWKL